MGEKKSRSPMVCLLLERASFCALSMSLDRMGKGQKHASAPPAGAAL